jgi:hypothetical protein
MSGTMNAGQTFAHARADRELDSLLQYASVPQRSKRAEGISAPAAGGGTPGDPKAGAVEKSAEGIVRRPVDEVWSG